jgi:spore germination protein YaaH
MKKLIPALIAIALIILVLGGSFGLKLLDRFSYSDEKKNLKEYYGLSEGDDSSIAIVLQNEKIEVQAKLINNRCYMDIEAVQDLLNERFYYDVNEGLLVYTTPTQKMKSEIGTNVYTVDGATQEKDYLITVVEEDLLYIALDYVKDYTNFSYELFTEPNRMQLRTQWGSRDSATIKKRTNLRVKGGVKSPILREVSADEMVTVLEEMETWTKVKTTDAMIGYVENKFLKNRITEDEIAVTDYEVPEYTSIQRDYKINLGWHAIYSEGGNDTFDSLVNGTGTMNVISPTWFFLDGNEGDIKAIPSHDYVKKAHSRNMEVWALLENISLECSAHEVLSYTSKREKLISTLMNYVLEYDIDGINVDFESLSGETGEHFTQFLRELSIVCRLNGIVLSVDNYVPRESNTFYNRKEQGVVADYVIIMGYDEHWGSGGVAGSVASIGYVKDGIEKTLEDVPAHKVINAVPFYTRVWKTNNGQVTSEALGMEAAQNFIEKYNVPVVWDEETCQNYGEIEMSGTLYQVWLEDAKSIETKLTVMKNNGLGGVAAWKLGFEDKAIWDVMDAFVRS